MAYVFAMLIVFAIVFALVTSVKEDPESNCMGWVVMMAVVAILCMLALVYAGAGMLFGGGS